MSKILVVEDDADTLGTVAEFLFSATHDVTTCSNAEDALILLKRTDFDLLILDCGLPNKSGNQLAREYRQNGGNARILFLTGKSGIENLLEGFEAGGDDYLTKAFDARELLMRVNALLKRTRTTNDQVLYFKSITMDSTAKKCTVDQSTEVKLTPREFSLLEFFMRNSEKRFTANELLSSAWSAESDCTDESVRVAVHRLRSKLRSCTDQVTIENLPGHGYKLK